MEKKDFIEKMTKSPVVAAVKDIARLDEAINSKSDIIFLLCGNIFNLKDCVEKVRKSGKVIFIHVDLIDGFSRDATALSYINSEIKPDGIISTKNSQLKCASQLGLLTVQRLFIIDSLSIETTVKASAAIKPDAVEIMPGIMPNITKKLSSQLEVPVIVGGLISRKEDIENAINSGARGVSTSDADLWN